MRTHPRDNSFSLLFGGLWLALFLIAIEGRAASWIFHLRNGDRITGEIASERQDSVLVRSVAGKIRIPVSQIDHREPAVPPSKESSSSSVATKASPNPASPSTAKPAPAAVGTPTPPSPPSATNLLSAAPNPWYQPSWIRPLFTNWHVNVQLGSDMGFGTTDRQTYYGNASAIHRWDRVRNSATASAAYGKVNGFESANRIDGTLKTDVDLGTRRKVYAFNLAGAGFDGIRRLDLQFQEGAGLGYKLIEKPRFILNTELGAQYQEFDFIGTQQDRNLVSVRIGEDLTWELTSKLRIRQTLAFMPNISDLGDFRAQYTLNFSYPLLKRTTINLNVIDLYDTNPVQGVNNNDLTIQTTLGVSF